MRKIFVLVWCLFIVLCGETAAYATDQDKITLTEEEKEYIAASGPLKMVVDPDWYPYEQIDKDGTYTGIAADLIALISQKTGLHFEIVKTADWHQSLEIAQKGEANVVSFLNKTDERSQWLLFTEPYFLDANVLITREEHDYVSNLARLSDETIVLPEGTSVEERLRKDYPNLKIVTVKREEDAIEYVEDKKADMTLRSMTMAAYIIKNDGHFNLKIAGEIPDYVNQLRMGITNRDVMLQEILNKGIASITEVDVQAAINNHVSINITKGFDYKLFVILSIVFSFVLLSTLYWLRKIQRLNRQLQASATTDALTGLKNRNYFNLSVKEDFERAKRYGSKLSLMIIDMDLFKRINDTYGHNAGDDVIKKLSEVLQASLRKADMLARWGGEEFVVLLPNIGLNGAIEVAEKLRREAEALIHLDKEIVTISIGVSTLTEIDTIESWFKRTDRSLYHAKQQGRNRVCISEGLYTLRHELITWNPAWESGHLGIDQQHIELVNDCNALFTSNSQSDIRQSILPELETVAQHVKAHFNYEEDVLKEMNYSDLNSHKKLHEELLQKSERLLQKSVDGNLLPSDVVQFIVEDMVTNHLIQEDTKFFNLFKEVQ